MVDISMCDRKDCKRKETCYRYLAFPGRLQSYLMLGDYDISNCEYYWRCRNARELREMNILNNAKDDEYI